MTSCGKHSELSVRYDSSFRLYQYAARECLMFCNSRVTGSIPVCDFSARRGDLILCLRLEITGIVTLV